MLIDSAREDIEQVLATRKLPWLRRGAAPAKRGASRGRGVGARRDRPAGT